VHQFSAAVNTANAPRWEGSPGSVKNVLGSDVFPSHRGINSETGRDRVGNVYSMDEVFDPESPNREDGLPDRGSKAEPGYRFLANVILGNLKPSNLFEPRPAQEVPGHFPLPRVVVFLYTDVKGSVLVEGRR
jgi:hypothetical protein